MYSGDDLAEEVVMAEPHRRDASPHRRPEAPASQPLIGTAMLRSALVIASLLLACRAAGMDGDVVLPAFEAVEAMPLTERIVRVHVVEGHVDYAGKGKTHDKDLLVYKPLDVAAAADP